MSAMKTYILAAAALLFSTWAAGAAPPNILLVITDDQGYGDLSLHGNPHLRTPNLDRFAGQSIRFEHFYVHPFCSPTRAALLTGRWPLRTGVWGVTGDRETMRTEEVTLAEALRAAGYRTGCFGKWHNGMQWPYTPRAQGFEEFFGFCGGHWNQYDDAVLEHNGRPVQTRGYITDVLTDGAIDFIRRHREEPFFCYVPFNAPHSPDIVPDKYFDRYKSRGLDDHTAAAYAMCENIDDNFARLLATLDELKLADNTIVLFLTDNGPNGQRFNAGMRGAKGSVHEGGCRVPLFIRWPAGLPQDRTIAPIAAHIDLYPTLLDLCGLSVPDEGPPIDGRSLRPLLEGRQTQAPARMLFTQQGLPGWNKPVPAAVRTQRYRAVNERDGWQLYDMLTDPGQQHDIAAEHPQLTAQLAAAYDAWFADVSAAGWSKPPVPVGHPQENPVELRATQASFDAPIRFFAGRAGFANDWLTGWSDAAAKIRFDLDVARGGRYAVSLRYTCPAAQAGSQLRLSVPKFTLEATVPAAEPRAIPLHIRDRDKLYYERAWSKLDMGTITLLPGRHTLTVQATSIPGSEVMDLKGIILQRLP
jgi:arylsulfatase A-like enzyme